MRADNAGAEGTGGDRQDKNYELGSQEINADFPNLAGRLVVLLKSRDCMACKLPGIYTSCAFSFRIKSSSFPSRFPILARGNPLDKCSPTFIPVERLQEPELNIMKLVL